MSETSLELLGSRVVCIRQRGWLSGGRKEGSKLEGLV